MPRRTASERRFGAGNRHLADHPAIAQSAARAAGLSNVRTLELDGEQHDTLPAGAFDAAISRVGLIYFPDQHKALTGIRHALKPGGRFATVTYSTADRNAFFAIPVGIIRRCAKLPPPLPGQPGPFSLGAEGVLADALVRAGFRGVQVERIDAPLRLASAAECVRFERESFGALQQMLSGLSEAERDAAWAEIAAELARFEGPEGFIGPCELLVGAGSS